MPDYWEAPQAFHDQLGEQAGRQRTIYSEGRLLLALHRLPEPGEREREGRFFWRDLEGR